MPYASQYVPPGLLGPWENIKALIAGKDTLEAAVVHKIVPEVPGPK